MDHHQYENLKIESYEPGISVIKISRPAVLNALNGRTLEELRSALKVEAARRETRVVILTGEGEKAFIAGADIAEMSGKSTSDAIGFAQLGHAVAKALELMPKPTIAAVNGFALGGGTEMAIACDFIVASEKAVFGQPEVALGVIPGFGGTVRLARYVGWPMAKELIFSGRRVSAPEAGEIGLANHVYPAEQFWEKTLELARSVAQQSASAVAEAKGLMAEFSESVGLGIKSDAEAQAFGKLFGTKDQVEGMGAFLQKRKAQFEGLANA